MTRHRTPLDHLLGARRGPWPGEGPLPYHQAAREDRSAERIPVAIPARLDCGGDEPLPVVIDGLSLSGFSCDGARLLRPGQRCRLLIQDLEPLDANIIWNDGIEIGCDFARLLDQKELDDLLRRFDPPGQE